MEVVGEVIANRGNEYTFVEIMASPYDKTIAILDNNLAHNSRLSKNVKN